MCRAFGVHFFGPPCRPAANYNGMRPAAVASSSPSVIFQALGPYTHTHKNTKYTRQNAQETHES